MPSMLDHLSKSSALLAALGFGAAGLALPAEAAGTDAWASFRKEVESSCLKVASGLITAPQIVVDPFGSESYGLAFLNGVAVEGGTTRSLVCIYDKAGRRAEIGGTMALESAVPTLQPDLTRIAETAKAAVAKPAAAAVASPAVPVAASMMATVETSPAAPRASYAAAALADRFLSPTTEAIPAEMAALAPVPPTLPGTAAPGEAGGFAGQCDATCALTLSALGEPDRKALADLAAEVKRTVDKTAASKLSVGPAEARAAALALAVSADGKAAGTIAPPTSRLTGITSCVLYYYGYAGEASRTVGRHRCEVSTGEAGGLVVEKVSGERLRAEIKPLTGEVAAFVGRTFDAGGTETRYDPKKPLNSGNDELGNTVGFAAAQDDGRLVLVSNQRRRFEDKGDFFWVLALDPK